MLHKMKNQIFRFDDVGGYSSIVDEEGSAEPWREKLCKSCTGRMTRGEMASCLGESSSCESQPGAVDGEDQGHVLGSSRRLDGRDAG